MTNTNESGRSMVEMLGVLAIIGVLSVMGIAGYTQAMKKYKINESVASISMAAMLCGSGQGVGGFTGNDYVKVKCNSSDPYAAEWEEPAGGLSGFTEAELEAVLSSASGTYTASDNTYKIVS